MNPYANVLPGANALLGNSQVGKDAAAAAMVGASQMKVLTPGSRVGVVGAGAGNWQTPHGGVAGEIAVPMQVQVPNYFEITVDTDGETEVTRIVLFDTKNLYAAANCGSCATDKSQGGCVYSGSKECNMYDAINNMLCSNQYLLNSLRVLACSSDGTGTCGFEQALSTKIHVWKGNINNDISTSSINLKNHISPTNFNNNVIDIPLTGPQALLDQYTAWYMDVRPNTRLDFTFFIGARS